MVKERTHDKRSSIAMKIAQELLDREMLNESNYCFDAEAILNDTSEVVLEHLRDYMLLSGTIF